MRSAAMLQACARRAIAIVTSSASLTLAATLPARAETPYAVPVYKSAAQVATACSRLIADARAQAVRLAAEPPQDARAWLAEFDLQTRSYEDVLGPLGLMTAVHPDKRIRDAAEACDLRYQAFVAEFQQSRRIYDGLLHIAPADAIDERMRRDLLDGFEDAGVALAPARRSRVKAINAEIARLAQAYDRRIQEDRTRLAYTADELAGVPDKVWRDAKRDVHGRYLLGLDDPTSTAVLQLADSAATRERMWRATMRQGGPANLAALGRIASSRREMARLFGFPSYDEFVLRRRMAKSLARVDAFLADVKGAVRQRELADLAEVRAAKAEQLHQTTETTRIERWDLAYYTERARTAQGGVDQEAFRAYFPPEASLAFVFKVAERLFGVQFRPLAQTGPRQLWHADARAFEAIDGDRTLGVLYVDLYPRADKYKGAEVVSFRNVSTLVGRKPAAALITNLSRQGLSIDELQTLLHEFGHALHALLSQTRYAAQGGTNVLLDFSEAPSQMLEDWVYDPDVLALFQEVCADCKPIPRELALAARRAVRFDQGIQFARQLLYASYDLAIYGPEPADPLALWQRMEGETPLGYVPGSLFPANFSHITQDYAAGYYGYLWSLAVAEDLRTAFAGGHRLDPAVGARYRASVLANGGQLDPNDIVRQFLGRDTDTKAFFAELSEP
ncbi:MAG: Zn-dependent oligopeptidase [Proteobacteria bacterium]|nr:Zn-dependent oligopeptidase [Pseudomonadota bacterium]